MSFWFTFVLCFYSVAGLLTGVILMNCKEPCQKAMRIPKSIVPPEAVTRSSGTNYVGYV